MLIVYCHVHIVMCGHGDSQSGDVMSQPTAKQLSYLNALISKSGMTREQWEDSVGLREHSPWGVRMRSEMITRQRVSVWIDMLRSK